MGKENKSSKKESPIATSASLQSDPTRDELYAMGKSLRDKCPRQDHAVWQASDKRPDPLVLIEESNKGRIQQVVPIRHGRMLQSPFTFYRGAALNMAADLATTPASGLSVQACGDCHLLNFGAFATPERRVIFDINDLDETHRAPWEWDVKRLAARFVLASRNNGFYALANTFGIRMAAVFMFVTSSIGLRTAFLPRWLAFIGFAVDLALLLVITDFAWIALLFPAWVLLVSAYILVADLRETQLVN